VALRRSRWADPLAGNRLYYGDNLEILRRHVLDDSVDLIYLDPPFNSNRAYNVLFKSKSGEAAQAQIEAFDDTWTWSQQSEAEYEHLVEGGAPPRVADAVWAMRRLLGDNDLLAYLVMMTARLLEMHRVLKETGSLYLHCDPTASHYLKVLCDSIFGTASFRNEIAWQRTATKGDARRKFGAVHDVILFYSKGEEPFFAGLQSVHGEKYTSRFTLDDGDGRGPYEGAPLDSPNPRPNLTYDYKGYPPPANGWRVSREVMEQLDADNRLLFPSRPTGRIRRKNYLNELKGRPVGDVWTDIPPINSQAQERLGYPTQKPLALLERIINASSNPGDVVLDPFCGCGTAVDAAQQVDRRWIGIDISYLAVALIQDRLADRYGPEITKSYKVVGIPHDLAGAEALFKANAFDFERWAVTVIGGRANEKQVGDRGVDGVIRFPLDKRNVGRILVSVKGGQQLNPAMVRDLRGSVEREKAEMGVLVTLASPTRGMVEEANHSGSYEYDLTGATFPRLQIITVPDILAGKRPVGPAHFRPYVRAKRLEEDNQLSIFEDLA
jgi:DNA modification methylase